MGRLAAKVRPPIRRSAAALSGGQRPSSSLSGSRCFDLDELGQHAGEPRGPGNRHRRNPLASLPQAQRPHRTPAVPDRGDRPSGSGRELRARAGNGSRGDGSASGPLRSAQAHRRRARPRRRESRLHGLAARSAATGSGSGLGLRAPATAAMMSALQAREEPPNRASRAPEPAERRPRRTRHAAARGAPNAHRPRRWTSRPRSRSRCARGWPRPPSPWRSPPTSRLQRLPELGAGELARNARWLSESQRRGPLHPSHRRPRRSQCSRKICRPRWQPPANRRMGDVEDRRDLSARHAVDIAQHEDGLELGVHALEHTPDLAACLARLYAGAEVSSSPDRPSPKSERLAALAVRFLRRWSIARFMTIR